RDQPVRLAALVGDGEISAASRLVGQHGPRPGGGDLQITCLHAIGCILALSGMSMSIGSRLCHHGENRGGPGFFEHIMGRSGIDGSGRSKGGPKTEAAHGNLLLASEQMLIRRSASGSNRQRRRTDWTGAALGWLEDKQPE